MGTNYSASGLARALFTATQQKVLALLFGQPERRFYTTELIDLAGSGRGAVQRELQRLARSGLVTVSRSGQRKLYQANPDCPVFPELRALVQKTLGIGATLRQALAPLADHIDLAILYGSAARGDDRADSDIDLLIVADDLPLETLYAALEPAERTLGRSIQPTLYTGEEFRTRRARQQAFVTRILEGPHEVLIDREHVKGTTRESGPHRQTEGGSAVE